MSVLRLGQRGISWQAERGPSLSRDWVNWVGLGQLGFRPGQEQLGRRVGGYRTATPDPVCGLLTHRMEKAPNFAVRNCPSSFREPDKRSQAKASHLPVISNYRSLQNHVDCLIFLRICDDL